MGEVYRAERADDQHHQQVALKRVRHGLEGEITLARFRAERQILALLDHPNIARLLDAGLASSREPYFVMQLIEGQPIDRDCDAHAPSTAAHPNFFCQVCEAAQYAHQHLTVHRDLKPANILQGQIAFEGADGTIVAGPGDSVWLPAGRPHASRNTGTTTARMLVVVTPGAQAHAFFSEVDATLHGTLVSPAMMEIAARHGIKFGPAPAQAEAA